VSLRARMALAAGAAVAIAVLAVAISAYAGTRSQLLGQTDSSLRNLARPFLIAACVIPTPVTLPRTESPPALEDQGDGGPRPSCNSWDPRDTDEGLGLDNPIAQAFGGPSGTFTLITRNGKVVKPRNQPSVLPADTRATATAASGRGQYFADREVGGHHLRVMVTGLRARGALEVALPLDGVDNTLHNQLVLLAIIAAAGIALAALLGLLVARTALAPIGRFTRQTEEIARRPDRIEEQRIEVHGGDEIARLAATFNSTLDALARSVRAQRNLVADASHELRTPIASIRANLQLMRDEALLSEADREALRADVIAELDELTALVGDVVELARGSKLSSEPGEVRLDDIVRDVLTRFRRRAPNLRFETSLEPTLVQGEGERIARAVSNLVDNAVKWSPEAGVVELTLQNGELAVRDRGPGFDEEDLPFVFDRFHRAKRARSKPGSGLGLAIVRQAAEAHGGFAQASNAPGGGAMLRVSFGPPLTVADPEERTTVQA
jgi:two-component system sensor histidine kinase MprB